MQILVGAVVPRPDMKTLHEEADVMIAKQVLFLAAQGMDCIRVICDDTDVVVLLMHYCFTEQLTCQLYMVGPSPSRSTVNIKATVEKHSGLVKNILAAHALSRCDTVCLSLWYWQDHRHKDNAVRILPRKARERGL